VQRILQNTSADLPAVVTVAETGTDPTPDSATVTITRADGTVVVQDAVANNGMNGGFVYPLSPAQTALLDTLTAVWTFTYGGLVQQLRTQAEVVGGYHFTLGQLRQLAPLSDASTYTTAKLIEARTLAETTIEQECGRAFVPRYWRGHVENFTWPYPDVIGVRSATGVDGSVLTSTQLRRAQRVRPVLQRLLRLASQSPLDRRA
jgi:hypothetical protein